MGTVEEAFMDFMDALVMRYAATTDVEQQINDILERASVDNDSITSVV